VQSTLYLNSILQELCSFTFRHTSFQSFQLTLIYTIIMKSSISILTLLSASYVVAVPAPFQVKGPVVAAGTENVVMPIITTFGRREAAITEDFGKTTLKLRGALLAARNGQGKSNGNGNADAQAAAAAGDDQGAQDAGAAQEAAQGKGKGKGKNADKQKGML
jgi:hypothetical protein